MKIRLTTVIFISLVAMKLLGVLDISWVTVIAPLFFNFTLFLIATLLILLGGILLKIWVLSLKICNM